MGLSGLIPTFAVVAPLFVLGGLANGLLNVALVLAVQRWATPGVQSRVMAACEATINAAIGLSLGAGGLLLGPLGPRGVFVLAGAMGPLATVLAYRLPGDNSPLAPLPDQVRLDTDKPRRPSQLRALPSGAWTASAEPA